MTVARGDSFFTNLREAAQLAIGGRTVQDTIDMSMDVQGMNNETAFGPGTPLTPTSGYSQTPRTFDYSPAYNVASRPRYGEQVSFDSLRGLVESYDIAGIAITHRIDSLRSLPWQIVPALGVEEDITDLINMATEIMKSPDRELPYSSWIAKYLYDLFAFDAGCFAKIKNNAGRSIGLRAIDGTTIAPLLDMWGNRPEAPAPAYVQYVRGMRFNDLTADDIIYAPFRPQTNSPYGRAPLESVLLTASSDLRMQAYFLGTFTDGNIPGGFASAPESWSAAQIQDYQDSFDALIFADPQRANKIRWVPGGTTFDWPNKQTFDTNMAQWLLKKTAAAFHVTPASLGFTEDVNRSSGETQDGVEQRVGDLPVLNHLKAIFDRFLQKDVGLPVQFQFELGGEQEDRLATAQSDKIYIDAGVVSSSRIAELRFGIVDPEDEVVPRFIMTAKGPIALSSLFATSGAVDLETAAPLSGTVQPAEQKSIADITPPAIDSAAAGAAINKAALSDEMAVFARFAKKRAKLGVWRDFQFTDTDPIIAHRLNVAGYSEIRKAAGELVAAGLLVRATDTGRVLMLQRALEDGPNGGRWEIPGGGIEAGETPMRAAWREWQEEVGVPIPAGVVTGDWVSPNGIYAGFVYEIPAEASIPPRAGVQLSNPDDPDGDLVEAVAWWTPQDMVNNPVVRAEVGADMSIILGALKAKASEPEDDAAPLAKAGWRDMAPKVPQHQYDVALTDFYAPLIQKAIGDRIRSVDVAVATQGLIRKAEGDEDGTVTGEDIAGGLNLTGADLKPIFEKLWADAYAAGQHASSVQLDGHTITVSGMSPAVVDVNWDTWTPGNPLAVEKINGDGLKALLDQADLTIKGIDETTLNRIGTKLADGLNSGASISEMAGMLDDLANSDSQAYAIAHTESTRAVMAATQDLYTLNGVTEFDWVLSDGACTLCEAEEAANPHKVGDTAPPRHPYCRCAIIPVVSSIDASLIQTIPEGE